MGQTKVILNALGWSDGELSILIVDDQQIEELNVKYLNRKGSTNVIAFPMQTDMFSHISPHLLGDVVISIETAEREGKLSDIGVEERFTQLLIHGILHLLGYDHEADEDKAVEMNNKSNEIMEMIKNI